MKRRMLSMLLAIVMVVGMLPGAVFATEDTTVSTQEESTLPGGSGEAGTEIPEDTGEAGTEIPDDTGEAGTEIPDDTGEAGTEIPDDTGEAGTEIPDDTGGEDTAPAEITGVSVTVDGVEYTSGDVTITPETQSILYTVTGTNFANLSADNYLLFASGFGDNLKNSNWTIDTAANTATFDSSNWISLFERCDQFEVLYSNDAEQSWIGTGIYLTYNDGTGEEGGEEATRVIYVDESTFLASGYSHFYDASKNLLTTTREEQEDGWVKYTMPADAKYYLTFDGHLGGGGGDNYPELPTDADTYDPFSGTWSCSHPGYAEGNCRLCGEPCPGHSYENGTCTVCGEPCPGHTYDNACDAECNVCSEIREVGDHVYDGAEDAECNECGYVRDITPVQITGVSITVDGDTYTSGNVTITPDSTVILTVTGTNLQSGSDDHRVDYASGVYQPVTPDYFEISEDGTVATYEPSTGDFAKSSNFEITYCNNDTDTANRTVVPTGIYLTYDDGIAEENRARITGMSITIDGVVYDSSNTSAEDPAVITPNTEFITITVHGTAMQNCTTDHVVSYYSGSSEPILANNLWHFEADGTGAYHYYSSASALSDFARNTTPYELQYSNNGSFNAANPAIGSGVYIVYDDSTGGEEDTTPAEITGVSITIDGVVYDSSNTSAEDPAVVTPTSTVTLTVTGTNLQNGTDDNRVDYAYGMYQSVEPDCCEISEDGTIATYTPPVKFFVNSSNYEIKYYNNYTYTANRTAVSTGIYLTYVRPVPDSDGKIVVDMKDQYSDGWNGAAIEIYKNGTLEETATVDDGVFFNTASVDYDSTASYEFKWVQGSYDSECSFTIYVDGEEKLKVSDASVYENGETIWPQGDTGGEEGGDDTIGGEEDTTPAEITGVSITVDGVPYTSGNVTITPTSTVIFTVTGTNFANLSDDNIVSSALGSINPLHESGWTIDTETNTATRDFSDPISRFDDCDNYEVRYSNDGDVGSAYVGTGIYLTYDDGTGSEEDTTPAEITGVSITVDSVTYTEGDVTITPDTKSIIVTLTGTHFANLSGDYVLELGPGMTIFMNSFRWKIDSDANTATADFSDLNSEFGDHNDYEIMYSNGGGQGLTGTGIYLTYDDGTGGEEDTTPDSTGKILVDMQDSYSDGWNDAAIQIYKNGSLEQTVTVDKTSNTVFLDYDSTATYEFKWIKGGYDYECSFTIYVDGEEKLSVTDASVYENGETIWPQGDTGGEEGGDDTIGGEEDTTPAQITGVSITVDGVTYTEGDVTITPTSTIVFTITGTNFANLNDNNYLGCFFSTIVDSGHGFTIDTAANTATQDFTGIISSFEQCDDFEVIYSNDGTQSWIGTGIYLTYDDGIEANTTLAIGDNEITDGHTYTYTAEQDGSLYITVAELYYGGYGVVKEEFLGHWCAIEINGTAITDFVNSTEVKTGDTVTVKLISVDGDTYNGTVNLSWDASVMAEITGVSITIDGVEYVGSDTSAENPAVITSEAASVILTVHGTNLQNATSDQWVSYMSTGNCVTLDNSDWTKSEDGSLASLDLTFLTENFIQSISVWEIKYSSNGGNLEDAVTGLYVKYEHIAGEEEPIVIIQQPTDTSAKLGENYCTEVVAQGEGLKYQWYFKNRGSQQWHKSGVTDSTYDDVMTTARAGREVYCVVTDSHGNTVTTDTAKLIAVPTAELAITQQPNDASAKLGEPFCVTVEAQGDGLRYTWYWRTKGQETWNGSSQRDNTYDDVMTSARHNREVYCVITDAFGGSVTTDIATITGAPEVTLAITKQPENQTVPLGDPFNVTVEAVGDGLKYQWYFQNANAEKFSVSGQRDNSYDDIMTLARHNRHLYCTITDAWGNSVTTDPVVVIMATQKHELAITAQPENDTAKLGEGFCVTVEAQGDALKYQWYWRNAGAETWNISGQRDNTYDDIMTKARHNREVKCVITDMWGNSMETEVALITAEPSAELALTLAPTDAEAALGGGFCVTVEAQGDGLTYTWYFKNANASHWSKSGVTDNTYNDIMTTARAGRQIYCVITDIWGNSITTETVTLIRTEK